VRDEEKNMADWIDQHFVETAGAPPEQIQLMKSMDSELAERYTALRQVFYRSRPDGLDVATKELLFIALSVVLGNMNGVKNHVRPALRAGVTTAQMTEALMAVMLIGGVGAWGATGCNAWEAWVQAANEGTPPPDAGETTDSSRPPAPAGPMAK